MGTIRRLGAVGALAVVLGTIGCGPSENAIQKQNEQRVINDLRTRSILRQINAENESATQVQRFGAEARDLETVEPGEQGPPAVAPQGPVAAVVPTPAPVVHCPGIPANPNNEQKYPAVSALYECFRGLLAPAKAWDEAAEAFRQKPVADEPFSGLTLDLVRPRILRLPAAPRREFLPAELDELMAIYRKRREAYTVVEQKVFEVLRQHEGWLNTVNLPNMKGLLALMRNAGLVDRQIAELGNALGTIPTAEWRRVVPGQYITPYGFAYLIPAAAEEMSSVVNHAKSPFNQLMFNAALLETNSGQERITRSFYEGMRAADPVLVDVSVMTGRVAPAENAVRVAFLDTGIDYKKLPALGRFLALGGTGFTSADYSEGDENPWEPLGIVNTLGHGSGTTSSMLTVLSDLNDSLLRGGKLSLAMWKVFSNRQILAGAFQPLGFLWDSRPSSIPDALIGELSKPVLPHVISMSIGFKGWQYLSPGNADLLNNTPSLFVMAAGNQGAKVEEAQGPSSCFRDVPADKRPTARILCVGALKRGVTQDDTMIASYSNHGDLVDVYTLESYFNDVCPNGTSCATPVMAGMATAVLEKYPALTSEQVKQAIVTAAVEKEFRVEGRTETRKVRFFNPYVHYTKLMEEAGKLATPAPAATPVLAAPVPEAPKPPTVMAAAAAVVSGVGSGGGGK